MMLYLLQSTACLLILLIVFKVFLEVERMHQFNRFYLLIALLFSLVVPILETPITFVWWQNLESIPILNWANSGPSTEVIIKDSLSVKNILWAIYLLGAAVMSIRFLGQLTIILRKVKRYSKVDFNGYSLILTPNETLPHTFWKYIFLPASDYAKGMIEPELMAHELAHVRERHSADVMIIELLKIAFWFQPLIYIYQKSIRLNHEFLADAAVLRKQNNVTEYQYLLLDKVAVSSKINLASNLNFSLTKKRLSMMTKNTSRSKALVLSSLTIPLFAILLLAFSQPAAAQTKPIAESAELPSELKDIKDAYFQNATFVIIENGKKIKKKYKDLSAAEKEAIPMPPPPPPVPAPPSAPKSESVATASAPAAPMTLQPLKEGTIVEVDFAKNRIWIQGDDKMVAPAAPIAPPPPPAPPTPIENN